VATSDKSEDAKKGESGESECGFQSGELIVKIFFVSINILWLTTEHAPRDWINEEK